MMDDNIIFKTADELQGRLPIAMIPTINMQHHSMIFDIGSNFFNAGLV